eukprot:1195766-Prorocentrum_minimum.AAC.6
MPRVCTSAAPRVPTSKFPRHHRRARQTKGKGIQGTDRGRAGRGRQEKEEGPVLSSGGDCRPRDGSAPAREIIKVAFRGNTFYEMNKSAHKLYGTVTIIIIEYIQSPQHHTKC